MKDIKTFKDILELANKKELKLFQVFQKKEAKKLEITEDKLRSKVKHNLDTMKDTIKKGLKTNDLSESKLSGDSCDKLQKVFEKNRVKIFSKIQEKALIYALATSEQNARMGKIVACPTAGACGIVPACIISLSEELGIDEENQINALITSGMVGKIISNKLALAGAVMGCQGECGTASAMAAAAIVELLNGNNHQIIESSILTLKNILGLVCDPVAGLVEVPCVKRNAFLAINAFTGAQLALANIKSIIPPDEVIDAMKQIGELMSPTLKESSEGGLSVTKTALEIKKNLNIKWQQDTF